MRKFYLWKGMAAAAGALAATAAFGQYLPSNSQPAQAQTNPAFRPLVPQAVQPALAETPAEKPFVPPVPPPAIAPAVPPAAEIQVPMQEVPELSPAVQTLLSFKPSDVKFDVDDLMDILRDKRHEGWVLAAYPDPKTAQPLIGAGFSLDLPERPHPQSDPLNPNQFIEASSADLWQAAGLAPEKLKGILTDYYDKLATLDKRGFRLQIRQLEPQITDEDANALLRIGIIQAVENAKAYCRNFDRLSASQQMAMTQLVYQMGINLQEFSTFLTLMNQDNVAETAKVARADRLYWQQVQLSLVHSQWARLYRDRAKAVIAMLDPSYEANPTRAERRINAVLPSRHHYRRHKAHLRRAVYTRQHGAASRRRARTRKD
ncbi:MAG: hypothetical protein ACLGSD_08200 [Acidobacteriota bacterium]